QILSFTGDNASNNDTFTTELKDLENSFRGDESRTRCFAHTVNLIAKAFLRLFE
ncbi:hypothetical protein BDZ89DRAFT_892845, partial [Hymenopellis radicata]